MQSSPNMAVILILLSILVLSKAPPLLALGSRTLDGNVYNAIVNGEKDVLTFRDGSFQSKLSAERGYDKGDYTSVTKGDGIWFEAKTVSSNEGELYWTGVIEGNGINGSYLDTKKGWFLFGDTTKKKRFKGSLHAE